MSEDCVYNLVVVLQNCDLVFHAADRFTRVEMWTRLHKIVVRHRVCEHPRLEEDSYRRIDLARVGALLRWLFHRPLVWWDLDTLSNASLDHRTHILSWANLLVQFLNFLSVALLLKIFLVCA